METLSLESTNSEVDEEDINTESINLEEDINTDSINLEEDINTDSINLEADDEEVGYMNQNDQNWM